MLGSREQTEEPTRRALASYDQRELTVAMTSRHYFKGDNITLLQT